MKKTLPLLFLLAGLAVTASAAEPFLQLSLVPEVAIVSRTTQVNGLSFGIWNENPQASLELGFLNGNTGDSAGFSLGLVNYSLGDYRGIQWSAVNYCAGNFTGIQDGDVNVCLSHFTGLQYGYVNYAKEFTGLQLGAINYATHLHGVQLGAICVALNNPWFKEFPDKFATGFPVFNWSF